MAQTSAKILELFSNKKRYQIPLYQRSYVWTEENWDALWRDLTQLTLDGKKHFTGSIITKSVGDEDMILIDGQQRLTTFQVIFRLGQDLWKSGNYNPTTMTDEDFSDRISTIRGYTRRTSSADEDKNRLLIRKMPDQEAFQKVISGDLWKEVNDSGLPLEEAFKSLFDKRKSQREQRKQHLITTAYGYFGWKITKRLKEKGADELDCLLRILEDRFHVISASLDDDDEPQQAYGSSNDTGVALNEFDLLRNDLFLRVKDPEEQDKLYQKHWSVFDDNSFWEGDKPDKFLRDFLKAKLGPNADFGKRVFHYIYKEEYSAKLQDELKMDENSLKDENLLEKREFEELANYARVYEKMENLDTTVGRRRQFYQDLESIFENLKLTNLPPFLLYLEHEFDRLELEKNKRDRVYNVLESYVLRCQFRGGINEDNTTDQKINTLFAAAIDDDNGEWDIKNPKIAEKFAKYLDSEAPGRKWRKNGDIKSGLRSAAYQIRFNPSTEEYVWRMLRYIFYRIEGELRQDPDFTSFTIFNEDFSHWVCLKPLSKGQKVTISYNIGNLTFSQRRIPAYSSLEEKAPTEEGELRELNQRIINQIAGHPATWSRMQIEAREKELLDCFDEIWPPPEYFMAQKSEPSTKTITGQTWSSMIQPPVMAVSYGDSKELPAINTLDRNILFMCSSKAWPELDPYIEIVDDVQKKHLKPLQQRSKQLNITNEFLSSVRKEQAIASLVTRYGHLLEGTIGKIYEDVVCIEVRENPVIVSRTGLLEFATDILYEGVVENWGPDNLFGSIKCQFIPYMPVQNIEVKSEFLDQSIVSRKLPPDVKVTFNLNIIQKNGNLHFQARDVEPIIIGKLHQGKIKFFQQREGSGFITPNDYQEEIYINRSQVPPEDRSWLKEGQQVEFNIAETIEDRRSVAINVAVDK